MLTFTLDCRCCGKPLDGAVIEQLLNTFLLGQRATQDFCPACEENPNRLAIFEARTAKRMSSRNG
jgi:hypothetical protein